MFVSSGTPVPVYNLYRTSDGITNRGLALATVVYLGVTALALLLCGRLSNHLGRRPVAVAAVASSLTGCLVLTQVHTLPVLLSGRVLQGLACGVASTALGSYVVDTAPPRPAWLPSMITSSVPQFAIPVGALLSGALAQYLPAPRLLAYLVVATALAGCALWLWWCPETVTRKPGAFASMRPRVHVPQGAGRLMAAAGAGVVATWSLGGFFQAFAPAITADHLGTSNALVIAVVFASIMVLSPAGGSLSGRLHPATGLRAGLSVFTLATMVIVAALHAGSITVFLGAAFVAGAAMGVAGTGGMRAVLGPAARGDRAGVLATIYLVSYSGAAVPGLIAGQLSGMVGLGVIALCYAALVLLASITAAVLVRGGKSKGN